MKASPAAETPYVKALLEDMTFLEQVEVAATRSRKLLKVLAVLAVVGIVVLIIMKVAGGRDSGPELTVVEDPAPGDGDDPGGPAA